MRKPAERPLIDTQQEAKIPKCPDCPGCGDRLLYPHQHATACPVFKHADVRQEADFLRCGCGQQCVNYADHFEHLRTIWRNRQFELIDAGLI